MNEPGIAQPFAIRGRVLIGTSLIPAAVVVDAGRIVQIVWDPGNAQLPATVVETDIISPGFIDLQVNGGFGCEVGDDPVAIRTLARRLPESGVTAFLPTVISLPGDCYAAAFHAFRAAQDAAGAKPLGLHLEGPFLSPKRPGAHRAESIEAAGPRLFESLLHRDALRLMTLAPERPGAIEIIKRLRERGVVVSLGHTDACFEECETAVKAGATLVTHLFNAMAPFQHRAPNATGAALVDDRLTVSLIVDGIHCHPASLEVALRAKSPDRIVLVTDMVCPAGMPDERYEFGGREVWLERRAVRLPDGTLAGSALFMDQAVRNMVTWTSASLAQVLRMASEIPARLLGLQDKGRIEVGMDADLVLLDANLQVLATLCGGRWAYRRQIR